MKQFKSNYTLGMMSKQLNVSTSGFYSWMKSAKARQKKEDKLLLEIKTVFRDSFETYGSPRISVALAEKNIICSQSTIARKMKSNQLCARKKRKFIHTTDSNHNYKVADNLLNRNFDVERPNTVWVSDITYISVGEKWMYLTTMIDLADRAVVGWSLSKDMTTENTVNAAFRLAVKNRKISKKSELMIHSDRGIQYASKEFRALIYSYGCIQSMSRKGNCWDNAVAESFFKTIKVEALNKYHFNDVKALKTVLFRYIDGWYNTMRIHTTLGGISPLQAFIEKGLKLAA